MNNNFKSKHEKEIEIHKNMISGETEIKTLYNIYVERDSISLGDDVTAPHGTMISFEKNEKLSDFFSKLINNYLDHLHNAIKWKVASNNITLGYIIYSENPKYELVIPDDFILNLNIKTIYCSIMRE